MKANPTCIKCGDELTEENWYPSHRKVYDYTCKECNTVSVMQWRKANIEKRKAQSTRQNRMRGRHPFDENRECPAYLGVHVAERVLSHVFEDVEVMPHNNPGYDFVCNRGKKIDVKSACLRKDGVWLFSIRHNTAADFFLCLAFDNREDLNPLHAWLLPGAKVSHLTGAGISPTTIDRWDEYRLDTSKINTCCDTMKVIASR